MLVTVNSCAECGHEPSCAGHRWLWHWYEQYCSLSGIPSALTLMYVRKRCSHHREETHEDTGEEKWRGHEGAVSGDMAVKDMLHAKAGTTEEPWRWTTHYAAERHMRDWGPHWRSWEGSSIKCSKNSGIWTWGNGDERWFLSVCLTDRCFSQYLNQYLKGCVNCQETELNEVNLPRLRLFCPQQWVKVILVPSILRYILVTDVLI